MYAGRVAERGAARDASSTRPSTRTRGGCCSRSRARRPRDERLRADRRLAAEPDPRPERLRVPPALPACVRDLPARSSPRLARVGARPRGRVPPARSTTRARASAQRARAGRRERQRVSRQPLVDVRDLVKHFPLRAGSSSARRSGAVHAVDGVSFDDRARRDARARRRVRLRQVDGRAARHAAARADERHDRSTTARTSRTGRGAGCGRCGARCRWSSRTRTRRSTRAARSGRSSASRSRSRASARKARAPRARARAARAGRPQPGALQPLPARVLRRPAAADRDRPRADHDAEADRRRRAGVGARRLDPGADPQPARGPPATSSG